MFEIDYKNLKKGRRFPLIFLIVGIICALIFGAIFAISTIKRNSLDRQIYATSIDPNEQIDNEHHLVYSPIYHYTVEGKEYTCSDNTSSSKRPSSEGIVYYSSKDPSKCMTDYAHKINYYLLIGVGIGAIFIGIGAFMMVKNSKKINNEYFFNDYYGWWEEIFTKKFFLKYKNKVAKKFARYVYEHI